MLRFVWKKMANTRSDVNILEHKKTLKRTVIAQSKNASLVTLQLHVIVCKMDIGHVHAIHAFYPSINQTQSECFTSLSHQSNNTMQSNVSYMVWNGLLQPPFPHCRQISLASTARQQWYPLPRSGYEWQLDGQQWSDPEQHSKAIIIMTNHTCRPNWHTLHT